MQSTLDVTTSLGVVETTLLREDINDENEQSLGMKRNCTSCSRISNTRLNSL